MFRNYLDSCFQACSKIVGVFFYKTPLHPNEEIEVKKAEFKVKTSFSDTNILTYSITELQQNVLEGPTLEKTNSSVIRRCSVTLRKCSSHTCLLDEHLSTKEFIVRTETNTTLHVLNQEIPCKRYRVQNGSKVGMQNLAVHGDSVSVGTHKNVEDDERFKHVKDVKGLDSKADSEKTSRNDLMSDTQLELLTYYQKHIEDDCSEAANHENDWENSKEKVFSSLKELENLTSILSRARNISPRDEFSDTSCDGNLNEKRTREYSSVNDIVPRSFDNNAKDENGLQTLHKFNPSVGSAKTSSSDLNFQSLWNNLGINNFKTQRNVSLSLMSVSNNDDSKPTPFNLMINSNSLREDINSLYANNVPLTEEVKELLERLKDINLEIEKTISCGVSSSALLDYGIANAKTAAKVLQKDVCIDYDTLKSQKKVKAPSSLSNPLKAIQNNGKTPNNQELMKRLDSTKNNVTNKSSTNQKNNSPVGNTKRKFLKRQPEEAKAFSLKYDWNLPKDKKPEHRHDVPTKNRSQNRTQQIPRCCKITYLSNSAVVQHVAQASKSQDRSYSAMRKDVSCPHSYYSRISELTRLRRSAHLHKIEKKLDIKNNTNYCKRNIVCRSQVPSKKVVGCTKPRCKEKVEPKKSLPVGKCQDGGCCDSGRNQKLHVTDNTKKIKTVLNKSLNISRRSEELLCHKSPSRKIFALDKKFFSFSSLTTTRSEDNYSGLFCSYASFATDSLFTKHFSKPPFLKKRTRLCCRSKSICFPSTIKRRSRERFEKLILCKSFGKENKTNNYELPDFRCENYPDDAERYFRNILGNNIEQHHEVQAKEVYLTPKSFGEAGSGFKTKGEAQDFYSLREYHLNNGTLYEDPEFPADDSSLFYSQRPDRYYEWKRPGEIVDNPQLFVEGYSRFDVQQGELGDCWLLAAVANITLYRKLFFQIVPDDQGFDDKYAGIFHFRFWQYGKWIEVVIDDRLPTYRGQLIYLHSTEENEFWSALLEKAYAKLHGSYEALKGGSTCEAMEDFTGGVTEMYEMNATPPNLFKIMLKAYERGSLMGCSIEPDPHVLEAQTPEGLIKGHAYSITRIKYVDIQTPNTAGKIPLLRLRNPWGNESEWTGAWSDRSPEWRFIPEHEKEELGLTFDDDGEFWMSFKDFQEHFTRLEICNLSPDCLTEEECLEGNKKKWEMSVFEGSWVRGVTAGGCRNYLETFWNNPQYRITLTEVDEGDDESKCTVIIALMQKNRRAQRVMGVDLLTIGFAVYYLPYPDRVPKPLDLNFFKYNASVARSPSFINLREVSCRFKLPPGTYCIVPSTFDPNEEGEFLLRVFSEHKNNMEENDDHIGYGEMDSRIRSQASTPEEEEKTDKVKEYFLKLAGSDMEIDWVELKDIIDYAMRDELPTSKAHVSDAEAAVGNRGQSNAGNNILTTLLGLICTRVCKDTRLAEIIPNPETSPNVESQVSYHEFRRNGVSKDICRSMIAMLDADKSGKLGFEEFKKLWLELRDWKNVFKLYDRNNSGALTGFELRQALNSAGYRLNNHILNIIMHRYGNKKSEIEFDDFLMCAIKLKIMIEKFKNKQSGDTNSATFGLEEWIETTLYS